MNSFIFVFFTLFSQADPYPRPASFVVVNQSGRHRDIQLFHTRHGAVRWLTATAVGETSLICLKKRVFFVAGEQVMSVDVDRPKQETSHGVLPKELVAAMGGQLRHFLRPAPDGAYLAWPGASDIVVRGVGSTFTKNITPQPGSRVVHPVFWRPGMAAASPRPGMAAASPRPGMAAATPRPGMTSPPTPPPAPATPPAPPAEAPAPVGELAYLTQNPAGTVWLHFHPLARLEPRLTLTVVSGTKGTVTAYDLHFSRDGMLAALNLDLAIDARKTVRYFLVVDVETGNPHTLNPAWKLEKFHGFSPKGELVLTGRIASQTALYYWNPANPRSPHLVEALLKREVYDYFPNMEITLMHTSGQKCTDRPRLISLTRRAQDRRLLKWAEWAEVIALDSSRVWGIFRAGGTCVDTKPALYLMKMDGSGLLDEMPRARFSVLQNVAPEQVSICD